MITVLARDNVELYFDRAEGEKVLWRMCWDENTFLSPPPDSCSPG